MGKKTRRLATVLAAAAMLVLPATAAVADEPGSGQICLDLTINLFGQTFGEPICLP